jgi:hypothetical protein
VPDTSEEEIAAALHWASERAFREADQLERYLKARAGQRVNAGKQAQRGDGTLPFPKKGRA